MKAIGILCICGFVAWVAMSQFANSAAPKSSSAAPSPSNELTDIVASFYKVLLQKEPPTLEQEENLFGLRSSLRVNLLARKKGADTDPVVLQLFRQNRDLFLPLGKDLTTEDYMSAVQISTPFNFVRRLETYKEKAPAGRGYVMALFGHDFRVRPQRSRTIVFSIEGGKIDPDDIYLDGFQGQLTMEKFMVVPKTGIE
jgi:hypothetical protein